LEIADMSFEEDCNDSAVGVRFPLEEKRALVRAAAADGRPVASLVRKIVRDRLRETGHLSQAGVA
jgi:hypothetical protein